MTNRKQALITGAAGGIGEAVSRRFLKEGYRVILVDKNQAALQEKFGNSPETDKIILVAADLEDEKQTQAIRTAINNSGQELSAAAFCHGGCVVDTTPFPELKYWEMNYRNNMIAGVNAFQACAEGLKKGKGNLVILSSVDAILGLEGAGPYDAAKAAQISLAKSISRAYCPEVCAITLVLGTVYTQAWQRAIELDPKILEKRGNENLSGRVITPDEVAGLIWLLCQEEARIMRGQSVIADNGWSFLAGTFKFDQRKTPNASMHGWCEDKSK